MRKQKTAFQAFFLFFSLWVPLYDQGIAIAKCQLKQSEFCTLCLFLTLLDQRYSLEPLLLLLLFRNMSAIASVCIKY